MKNDVRDAEDLADLLRLGRLQACTAPSSALGYAATGGGGRLASRLMSSAELIVAFDRLPSADLVVDAIYDSGPQPHVGADPLSVLLPGVGNQGGFRAARHVGPGGISYAVLYTTGDSPDWPDALDLQSGQFTYYGDNRSPGRDLHDTSRGGNLLLRDAFDAVHSDGGDRSAVPPFLVFERAHHPQAGSRAVRFLGLAVPGAADVPAGDDLVAIWRSAGRARFQNYRAVFTILDCARVSRAWLGATVEKPHASSDAAPDVWEQWVARGRYVALRAMRQRQYRTREQQLPASAHDGQLLRIVYEHFRHDPHAFESCAIELWRLHSRNPVEATATRPSRDGGRDAIGVMSIGPAGDPLSLDFALEAKCYEPGRTVVSVRDTARLVSRLRHRQFGVLVTTSFVHAQAYAEMREDGHPVVVISGGDIVAVLKDIGIATEGALTRWLGSQFGDTE